MDDGTIVEGTDVWESALPGDSDGEEEYADGTCALCGQVIQIPLGPHVFRGQCACGTHFWIGEPDGDDFDTICGLIEESLGGRPFIFQQEPVDQCLANLAECDNFQKIRDQRFGKKELITEYGQQDWMLGYICFLKLDPPPTMEMFQ